MRAQGRHQLLADGQRTVQDDPSPGALAAVSLGGRCLRRQRGGQEALLGLGPEALERADLLALGGRLQRGQRIDRQLVVQPPGALGSESGQARDLQQAGGKLGSQPSRRRDHPVVGKRQYLLLNGGADAWKLGRAVLAGQSGDRDGRVADRLGRIAVRDDAVDDGAVELVQVPELVQRYGDLGVGGFGHPQQGY